MIQLKINNITKSYGNTIVLDHINFAIPEGVIYGILGPNGSGKTTLLAILMDILKADQGTFEWNNIPDPLNARKNIGCLLETPNFYPYLSAFQNLKITQQISGRGHTEDIYQALQKVGLYERKDSRFDTFSLGMKQRLAIAAAILGNPKIILLDEPTNGLDPVGIVDIRKLILDLQKQGHTVIIASHLLDEVEKVCSHVAIMKKGKLLVDGKVDQILKKQDIIEIGYSNYTDIIAILSTLNHFIKAEQSGAVLRCYFHHNTVDTAEINKSLSTQGIYLNHLTQYQTKLEELFFEITK